MLPAEGPAELQDQVCHCLSYGFHFLHAGGVLEIDQGSDVKASDARVAIVGCLRVVSLYYFVKAPPKLA